MGRAVTLGLFAGVLTAGGVALAADWSDAADKAAEFKAEQESLKGLTPDEVRRIVTAICEAEEDDRKAIADEVKERVRSTIDREYAELSALRDTAVRALEEVAADESQSEHHGAAAALMEDVKTRWEIVERMTVGLRGANHPVVAWMLEQGQLEHRARQDKCDVSEFTLRSGKRVDCLMASGCLVIELKPNNSRALTRGRGQASQYAAELNNELTIKDSAYIKSLVDKKADFAKCEKFNDQVDCYKLCPDIDGAGEFRAVSVDWDDDC